VFYEHIDGWAGSSYRKAVKKEEQSKMLWKQRLTTKLEEGGVLLEDLSTAPQRAAGAGLVNSIGISIGSLEFKPHASETSVPPLTGYNRSRKQAEPSPPPLVDMWIRPPAQSARPLARRGARRMK
jgi:hypothetical protein